LLAVSALPWLHVGDPGLGVADEAVEDIEGALGLALGRASRVTRKAREILRATSMEEVISPRS